MTIHLRLRVAAARRDEFLAFLRDAVPFYERPGGIRVRLLRDERDPETYIEVIEYASRDAYERDQQRVEHDLEMRARLQRWRALLEGPPVVEVYAEDERSVQPVVEGKS
ncbi:MAG: hypothetical protein EA379_01800 [Phycisphaerales bacterium]|nr:MAG: hypothetical protein EA379_01800 [Phycisphaerales bacterium]